MTDIHAAETAKSFQEPDEDIVAILGKYYVHENYAAIDQNIFLARQMHRAIFDTPGLASWCAHTHTAHFEVMTSCGEGKFQRVDRQIVKTVCKAAILLPNWRSSKGSINEAIMCNELNIPVFQDADSLYAWSKDAPTGEFSELESRARGTDGEVTLRILCHKSAPFLSVVFDNGLRSYNGGGLDALCTKR